MNEMLITPAGLARLEAELDRLRTDGRRDAAERLRHAATTEADVTESADYRVAREEKERLAQPRLGKADRIRGGRNARGGSLSRADLRGVAARSRTPRAAPRRHRRRRRAGRRAPLQDSSYRTSSRCGVRLPSGARGYRRSGGLTRARARCGPPAARGAAASRGRACPAGRARPASRQRRSGLHRRASP
jgi:hypothetical protein